MNEFHRGFLMGADSVKSAIARIIEARDGRLERLNGTQVLQIMQQSIDISVAIIAAAIEKGEFDA